MASWWDEFVNTLSQGVQDVKNTASDIGNALPPMIVAPIRDTANILSGGQIGYSSQDPNNPLNTPSGQRGLQDIQGMTMANPPEVSMGLPSIGDLATQGKGVLNDTGKVVSDTMTNAKAQPGGLQAGFIKPSEMIGKTTEESSNIPMATQIYNNPSSGILDSKGNPISTKPPTPEELEMGQYTFEKNGDLIKNNTPIAPAYGMQQETPSSGLTSQEKLLDQVPVSNPSATLNPNPKAAQLSNLSLRQQAINKLAGIDRYQGATKEGEDFTKNVLTREVKGNTWNQKFADLEPAKQRVWARVINGVKNDTTPVDISNQIAPYVQKYLLNDEMNGLIDKGASQTVLTNLKSNLNDLANKQMIETPIEGAGPQTITPNTGISKLQLVNAKTAANSLTSDLYDNFGKVKDGLNQTQRINLAVSRGLRDAVNNIDPETGLNTKIYGALKNVSDQMGRGKYRNENLEVARIPGVNIGVPFTGLGRQFGASLLSGNKTSLGLTAVSTLGGLGATGLLKKGENAVAGALGYAPKSNAEGNIPNYKQPAYTHIDSIPNPYDQLQGLTLDPTTQIQTKAKLDAESKNPAFMSVPSNREKYASDLANYNAQKTNSDLLQPYLVKANSTQNVITSALQTLQKTAPDLRNANQTLADIRNSTDSTYTPLISYLETLDDMFYGGKDVLFGAWGSDVLHSRLIALNNTLIDQFNGQIKSLKESMSVPASNTHNTGLSTTPNLGSSTTNIGGLPLNPSPSNTGVNVQAMPPMQGVIAPMSGPLGQ